MELRHSIWEHLLRLSDREYRVSAEMDDGYAITSGERPCRTTFADVLRYLYEAHVAAIICRYKGHDIVEEEGWCTPDSGGMEHHCRRCKQSWTTILY